MKRQDPKKPNEAQIDKFKKAAAELETDPSEENFDRILRTIAKSRPQDEDPTPKRGRGKA